MIRVFCVAYGRLIPLRILIDSFMVQTSSAWELYIIYDGQPPREYTELIESYNSHLYCQGRINFTWSPVRRQQYGHPNRKYLLDTVQCDPDDFILMTNDDNYYVPVFVKEMLQEADSNTGIVSCNTIHSHFAYTLHESKLVEYGIDMGAFIVSVHVAKSVGFNNFHFSADGVYANKCAEYCNNTGKTIKHIPKPLFIHN
jgi:hypothetical protein